MHRALFLAATVVGLVAAGTTRGQCPSPTLQANFDAVRYMGTWFEQARDSTMPWESNDCQQARYSLNADGTVAVYNTQYNPATDIVEGANATATFDGAHGKVKFFWYAPAGDYQVLASDYENYAIVYSCSDFYLAKTEYIWVLTRAMHPDQQIIVDALNTLKAKVPGYDQTYIRRTLHGDENNCKYFGDNLLIQ